MTRSLEVESFLAHAGTTFDVRSPSEFAHAALPSAYTLPLFSDSERAQVGTCYKQVSREAAIELGLRLVGPRLADMAIQAKALCTATACAKVYCWRGGMRSASVAWLLETAGIPAVTLKGGYKSYRGYCLRTLENISEGPQVVVLGGMTGSGKTALLHALAQSGEQILDLEALAGHRGSSYGMVGMPSQPSNEHFENEIARAWKVLDPSRRIWVEDESAQIGRVRIPHKLFEVMRRAPLIVVQKPLEERVRYLVEVYGCASREELVAATMRLKKHLGGQRMAEAVRAIEEGRLEECVRMVLGYYDAAYAHNMSRRTVKPTLIDETSLRRDLSGSLVGNLLRISPYT